MLRVLQTITNKHAPILHAGEALTRGAIVGLTADNELEKAGTLGLYFVDLPDRIGGEYACWQHNDTANENILEGEAVVGLPIMHGERYATTEIDTPAGLTAGDGLKVSGGKLAKVGENDVAIAYFMGAYTDPDFANMYEVVIA